MKQNKSFDALFGKASKKLGVSHSTGAKSHGRHSVWCSEYDYKRLRLLTFEHEHTTIMHWVNIAIEHSYHNGKLRKRTQQSASSNHDSAYDNARKLLGLDKPKTNVVNRGRHPVWCSDYNYHNNLVLLTLAHPHTTIMHWVNLAIENGFKDGVLK